MPQTRQFLSHGFGPVYDENSRLLILGSFPSAKSKEENFYYGHSQNRFWRVMAALCQAEVPLSRGEKLSFLLKERIALYDVIESCSIIGSADNSIEDVEIAELSPILQASAIGDHIFINGAKAYGLYNKYILPEIGIAAVKLPSTSPANAAFSLERLVQVWGDALRPLLSQKEGPIV